VNDATLALRREYADETLLIPGLSADGIHERYHFIDLDTGKANTVEIDIGDLRERQLAVLRAELPADRLPYGLTTHEQLLPYLLHPHSFTQLTDGEIVVGFKQAPYLRHLDRTGKSSLIWAGDDGDFSRIASSTNDELAPNVICLVTVDASRRYARYRDGTGDIPGDLLTHNLTTGETTHLQPIPNFVIDTLHEIVHSDAGFFVGVDMNLSVDLPPGDPAWGNNTDELDVTAYTARPFPRSQFFVADHDSPGTVHTPSAACAAHVDMDLNDPHTFYISCNNISKYRNQVVVHGPGALDKYRYSEGVVTKLGSYTSPDFLRITTQLLFRRNDKQLLAVTQYPNRLAILDPDTMRRESTIELFQHEQMQPPFACQKNTPAPLYLTTDQTGRYIFLTGSSTLYIVDLDTEKVVDTVQFCPPGSFAATAHIGIVRC
jgi:hypothetical protein